MEKEITLTRIYDDVPVEKVWQAWTDASKVQHWWSPKGFSTPVCEIDPQVGGEIYIVMLGGPELGQWSGMKAPMKGVFEEVVENERLVFTTIALDENGNHLLEGETTVTFEDIDGNTKLTVKTGAEGLTPQAPQMLAGMEQGWNEQLDKLEYFLE